MSDNVNLASTGADCIAEAAYGMAILDLDKLSDDARERIGQEAENACIYTHNCLEIINRYERDVNDADVDDVVNGKDYKAGEWRAAMEAYAFGVAYVVIGANVEEGLTELQEAAEHLVREAAAWGAKDCDLDSLQLGRDCTHGWAVHDKEDEAGVHYWSESNLEGCRTVAIKSGDLWLSYTWTPGREASDA